MMRPAIWSLLLADITRQLPAWLITGVSRQPG
jgi:hypothetical protein